MKARIKINTNYMACLIMFIGVFSLLSVIALNSDHVAAGEMAYQKLWLGRMAIAFVVCCSISMCLDKKGAFFCSSIVWSLILLAGLEAIWGIRQIYGLVASNHSLFTLTGSFYNPGPYSGYLAMVFPICLSEWLLLNKKKERSRIEQGKYYLSLGVLLLTLCVLPAGMSRSAWIAAAASGLWVYGMHHSWGTVLKQARRKYRKRVLPAIIVGGVVLIMVGYALYNLKKDSASGRLLMWKISAMTIAEKPIMGYGLGSFAQAYGDAQENYFGGGDYSETEEQVAGSMDFAFNEYLQVAVEWGISVLLVILLVIGFSLWVGITEKQLSACGGVISVLLFAFSSYPMQIPAFAVTFFFLLAACAMGRSRGVLLFFMVMIALLGAYHLSSNQYDACRAWTRSKMIYNIGAYESARKEYEELYPELNDRGAFLFEYGHCLHKLKQYQASTKILKEAMMHSSDPMILNIIGKNYQSLKEYEQAEQWLVRSTHRLPGRIYPYYLLVKLYAEPEYDQPEKLKRAAEVVLTKEPKVQSTAVKEMRREVAKLLNY